jgi:hypothetical protein
VCRPLPSPRHRCAFRGPEESFVSSKRATWLCHFATDGSDDAVFLVLPCFLRCGPALKRENGR